VKVLISIGGENSGKQFFNAMSRDPKALNRFVDSVTDLLVKNHYDGVDIDWEFPENERDGRNITVLASLLRKKLGQRAPGALLTMALPSGDWVGKWFDAASLSSLLDFANVMTYDFHGPWGANGHNAALYPVAKDPEAGANIVKTMDYWTQQKKWPGKKLLVGIACFGHGFVGGWYENPKKKTPYPDFHFTDSLKMVQAGWKKHWDKEAAVPYLASLDGKEFISYDDEKSVGLKAQWARANHYPGIFFWEITEDFMNDRHVLVEAARKAFLGK
jgi:chitinase